MELSKLIILDTEFLSHFLFQEKSAISKMEELLNKKFVPVTTVITQAEMFFGAFKKKWGKKKIDLLSNLFESLAILNFTSDAAVKFGEIRAFLVLKRNDIGFADTVISSIALTNDSYVLTRNVNHFFRIDDLKVMEYLA